MDLDAVATNAVLLVLPLTAVVDVVVARGRKLNSAVALDDPFFAGIRTALLYHETLLGIESFIHAVAANEECKSEADGGDEAHNEPKDFESVDECLDKFVSLWSSLHSSKDWAESRCLIGILVRLVVPVRIRVQILAESVLKDDTSDGDTETLPKLAQKDIESDGVSTKLWLDCSLDSKVHSDDKGT